MYRLSSAIKRKPIAQPGFHVDKRKLNQAVNSLHDIESDNLDFDLVLERIELLVSTTNDADINSLIDTFITSLTALPVTQQLEG